MIAGEEHHQRADEHDGRGGKQPRGEIAPGPALDHRHCRGERDPEEQGGKGDPLLRLGLMLSEHPARVLGLYPRKGSLQPGADADIIIVSPDDDPNQLRSSLAETYEPYPGFLTRLRMHSVLVHGVPIVHDGFLLDTDHPQGSCTWES